MRQLADRHYNRRSVGAQDFVPPGRCVVLRTGDWDAFWVTSWQAHVRHAWPGAWVCSAFRNEGSERSSDLIVEALAATCAYWPDRPRVGAWARIGARPDRVEVERVEVAMITFVDASKTRAKRDPGRCYLRAGFERIGMTQGGLVTLGIRTDRLPPPCEARGVQTSLFG